MIRKMAGGITFRETTAPPALPDGRAVISPDEAIRLADKAFNPGDSPGARVSAVFGHYYDDQFARVSPSGGRRQLYYQGRAAWLVRYTAIDVYAVGGSVYDETHPKAWRQDVHHEQNIFIDAATGEFLGGITYR